MNFLQKMKKELDDNCQDFTTLEKCIYLYKRCAEEINYDERWRYCDDDEVCDKILNFKPDIENIDNFSLVCSSASYTYFKLLIALLSEEEDFKAAKVESFNGTHYYVTISLDDGLYLADLTGKRDLMLVKKGLMPNSFKKIITPHFNFKITDEIINGFKKAGLGNDLYLEYLKLVKNELQISNHKSFYDEKEIAMIFRYLLRSENFDKMGLIEAELLLRQDFKYITGESINCAGIDSLELYDRINDETRLMIAVPINMLSCENYVLKREKTKVVAEKLTDDPREYVKKYHYDSMLLNMYMANQNNFKM